MVEPLGHKDLIIGMNGERIVIGQPVTNEHFGTVGVNPILLFDNVEGLLDFMGGLVDFLEKHRTDIPQVFIGAFNEQGRQQRLL